MLFTCRYVFTAKHSAHMDLSSIQFEITFVAGCRVAKTYIGLAQFKKTLKLTLT